MCACVCVFQSRLYSQNQRAERNTGGLEIETVAAKAAFRSPWAKAERGSQRGLPGGQRATSEVRPSLVWKWADSAGVDWGAPGDTGCSGRIQTQWRRCGCLHERLVLEANGCGRSLRQHGMSSHMELSGAMKESRASGGVHSDGRGLVKRERPDVSTQPR